MSDECEDFWTRGERPTDELVFEAVLVLGEVDALIRHSRGEDMADRMALYDAVAQGEKAEALRSEPTFRPSFALDHLTRSLACASTNSCVAPTRRRIQPPAAALCMSRTRQRPGAFRLRGVRRNSRCGKW